MYEWSRVIFAKKSKFHDEGGPDTVVSPYIIIQHSVASIFCMDGCYILLLYMLIARAQ